jgi:hypothetical protein
MGGPTATAMRACATWRNEGVRLLPRGSPSGPFAPCCVETPGDIAIAFGADSVATADDGFGNFAAATTGALAIAGDLPTVGGPSPTGNNFDFASASGLGSTANAGNVGGAIGPDITGSSFDYASASSTNTNPADGATAVAGFNGSGDSASAVGQDATAISGASLTSTPANFDSASVLGNLTTPTNDFAIAGSETGAGGSNDTAFVIDPSGTVGSSAIAGEGFNSDLAGVFGDALHATANTANFLVDILPSL